ncbi:MAG TPA: hypothetical protein ACFYEK_11065 [Candidatus Wunengus sp. YC60]|uniref:hypothetical protein n=1 Tax=Candidatus Wunengus sp. YC60 TaxID=3367697 RepID=UPI00402A2C9D
MLEPHFNGPEYVEQLDFNRLYKQWKNIRDLMLDGKWRTLGEIEEVLGYPQASISANLRHLRKFRFGNFNVYKRRKTYAGSGLYEYKLTR